MAIIAQPPYWLVSICSLTLCAMTLFVSVPLPNSLSNRRELGTICQSTCVSHPHSRSTLKSRHRLFIAVIFLFPEMMHKLLKFSVTRRIKSDGFSCGAWPYLLSFQNLDKAHETSQKAEPSAWASWRAVTSMVGSCRRCDVCHVFRLVMAMMSLVVGRWLVRNWRSPRSNCRD